VTGKIYEYLLTPVGGAYRLHLENLLHTNFLTFLLTGLLTVVRVGEGLPPDHLQLGQTCNGKKRPSERKVLFLKKKNYEGSIIQQVSKY